MAVRFARWTSALIGAAALTAALPAAADVVTMSARFAADNPGATTSADYVAAWNAALALQPTPPAGYGDYVIPDWNGGQSNSFLSGGSATNIAYHDQAVFTVSSADAGLWSFRLGIDFGWGGTAVLDGVELQTQNHDMWWNYSFSDPSQYLAGSRALGAGVHTLDVYGFEGCCDGGTSGQFLSPTSRDFQDFTTTAGAAVPEPAIWTTMILGFGLAGAALRRRRTVALSV